VTGVDDLYGLPLERFVPERTALAKALRAGGEREQAAQVAKLRKPSVAAWAVNQLVRTQRDAVRELFDAGDRLQRAQDDVLSGKGDADAFRGAADEQRAALRRLSDIARGLLTSEGHELSETVLERVRDTLNAAALDTDARRQVADGRLERELRHVGLGSGQAPIARPKRRATKPPSDRKRSEQLTAARKAAQDAERAAKRAAGELAVARERRDSAAARLEAAESELTEARRTAEQAELAREKAERALRKPSN
jgi:hypothetical protein